MDTKLYSTRINIQLDSVGTPNYEIRLDSVPVTANINCDLHAGSHTLEIEHKNKHPHDATTALIVKSIAFNDIASDKFVWAGVYTPNYPEPWASEQVDLALELPANNYLGWNGVWRLTFTTPIFSWIHQVENLGWIYD
jgi:hypothetical protein